MKLFKTLVSVLGEVANRPALEVESDADPNLDSLVWNHFVKHSHPNHVNRVGLTVALRKCPPNALIVETGSSAWGTNSSRLFDRYVRVFGGRFITVDIRPEASQALAGDLCDLSTPLTGDSVGFLKDFNLPAAFPKIDLLYLDSFDLDLDNPWPSMEHGLQEFVAAEKFLDIGSVVVIDDTPIDACLLDSRARDFAMKSGFVPGKGALVLSKLDSDKYRILYHHYNLVLMRVG